MRKYIKQLKYWLKLAFLRFVLNRYTQQEINLQYIQVLGKSAEGDQLIALLHNYEYGRIYK